MRFDGKRSCGAMILGIGLLVASPALAGKTDNDGSPPTEDKQHGTGWNPTITCVVGPGDSLDDLMNCLADGITHPPQPSCPITTPETPDTLGGPNFPADIQQNYGAGSPDDCTDPNSPPGYDVFRWRPTPPHYGLTILRDDGTEIDRLYVWENDPAMQMTYVEVLRDGLAGRISGFVERPSKNGGTVTVTVNGFPFTVQTSLFKRAEGLTADLLEQMQNAGFEARRLGENLVIITDPLRSSIKRIRFQSNDPQIVSSNIGVAPLEEILAVQFLGP